MPRFLWTFFFSLFVLLNNTAFACKAVLDYISRYLDRRGILEQDAKGYVYVKVDDDYINNLYSLIEDEEFETPPYFDRELAHGAHISVIYKEEADFYKIGKIDEIGSVVSFQVKDCQIIHPPSWNKIDSVYLITLEAPTLEKIRKKYGLPPPAYPFHITIAVKYKTLEPART